MAEADGFGIAATLAADPHLEVRAGLLAYMRILGAGDYHDEPALGRILVTPQARGLGFA